MELHSRGSWRTCHLMNDDMHNTSESQGYVLLQDRKEGNEDYGIKEEERVGS